MIKTVILTVLLVLLGVGVVLAIGMTWGSAVEFNAVDTQHHRAAWNIDASVGVVAYTNDGNAGTVSAFTVSGTTVSVGSAVVVDSDWEVSSYDSYGDIAAINSNAFVVAYPDDGSDDDGYVEFFTVSGTTITDVGVKVEFNNSDTEMISVAKTNSNVFAICYNDETEGEVGECIACEYTPDTGATCGTEVDIESGVSQYPTNTAMARTDTNEFIVAYFKNDGGADDGDLHVNHGTVDAAEAITMGTTLKVADTSGSRQDVCSSFEQGGTADRFMIASGDGFFVCTISGSTITCGAVQTVSNSVATYVGCTFVDNTHAVIVGGGTSDYLYASLVAIDWSARTFSESATSTVVSVDTCAASPDAYCGRGTVTAGGYGTSSATTVTTYNRAGDSNDADLIAATVDLTTTSRRIMVVQ